MDQKCDKRPLVIAIGGSISAGKSTIVKKLESNGYPVNYEFYEDDILFTTLLEILYKKVPGSELALQLNFLVKHSKKIHEFISNFMDHEVIILDRALLEHNANFAKKNLSIADYRKYYAPLYSCVMGMNAVDLPDLYIILDVSWDEFKERFFARGRNCEIENWEKNKDYFKMIHDNYVDHLEAECKIWRVPSITINTNNRAPESIYDEVESIIQEAKNARNRL